MQRRAPSPVVRAPGGEPVPPDPPPPGAEPPDELFSALADGTRRSILRAVAEDGPMTATTLADILPVSRQAVAKHLVVLRDAGLVTAERTGRETRFTAATEPLDELAAWAESTGRRWDDRLARLRRRFG
ncbi:MAG: metalloregulator ArsR/SmtB family transcription factor [Acidimicrobiales bacterium]|nr:metalloregulator ArsR/SmtB family transcription factor [Acidimicrobiales bacterium]